MKNLNPKRIFGLPMVYAGVLLLVVWYALALFRHSWMGYLGLALIATGICGWVIKIKRS